MSQAVLSSVYWPFLFGRAISGRLKTSSFHNAAAALSFSSRVSKCLGWTFLNFLLKGAASLPNSGTNLSRQLHWPQNERSFVYVVEFSNCLTASFARERKFKAVRLNNMAQLVNNLSKALALLQLERDFCVVG